MAAILDGPRIEPKSGAAKQLVVFLHGYGADGNDLIEIGRAWQGLLPQAAFVSPHAPEACGQAPMGRQWFPLTFRDPHERWTGVNAAAPVLHAFLDSELKRHALPPAALALVGFSQGTMMALHVGLRRAVPPGGARRLFGPPRPASRNPGRHLCRRDQISPARCCSCMATATTSFPWKLSSRRRRGSPRSACQPNGISQPASATASTARGCAMAANFWLVPSAAVSPATASSRNSWSRLHNPVTPAYKLAPNAALRH